MSTIAMSQDDRASMRTTLIHHGALGGIVVALLLLAWALPMKELFDAAKSWTEGRSLLGAGIYVVVFVAFTIFSLPVWPLPFIAGSLFGPLGGLAAASLAIVLGATVTFGMARAAKRFELLPQAGTFPIIRAFQKAVETGTWKVVAAVRLAHFLTFGLQNYALGMTKIRFATYLFTTWAITLPGTALQAYLGHLGFSSMDAWRDSQTSEAQDWAMRIGGLVLLVGAVLYLGYMIRNKLAEVRSQVQAEFAKADHERRTSAGYRRRTAILAGVAAVLLAVALLAVARKLSDDDHTALLVVPRFDAVSSAQWQIAHSEAPA